MALNAYLPTMLQASPQIKTQPLLSDPLSVIMDTLGSPALFYHVAEFISYPALANLAACSWVTSVLANNRITLFLADAPEFPFVDPHIELEPDDNLLMYGSTTSDLESGLYSDDDSVDPHIEPESASDLEPGFYSDYDSFCSTCTGESGFYSDSDVYSDGEWNG